MIFYYKSFPWSLSHTLLANMSKSDLLYRCHVKISLGLYSHNCDYSIIMCTKEKYK